jgi:cyclohexanone monooxygenase
MAQFITRVDAWMQGTVWLTRCSNYFRAANGRVVTQWPRSARDFWRLTRRFRPGDYAFSDTRGHSRTRSGLRVGAHDTEDRR